MKSPIYAATEAEMIALGQHMASQFKAFDVVALVGELGAGKTHFCKGVLLGLDSNDEVTSPTFSLVNEYHGGRLPVFHFDFYRLESINELTQIGWDEYLDQESVLLIEWANKFPEALPETTLWCRFSIGSDQRRLIEYGIGDEYE